MANRLITADEATKIEGLKPVTYSFLASRIDNATTNYVSFGLPIVLASNKVYFIEMYLKVQAYVTDASNNFKLIFQTTAASSGMQPLLVESAVYDTQATVPVFVAAESTVMVGVDDNETKIYTPATALGNSKVAFVKVSGVYNSAMFGETITTKFCAVTTGAGKGVSAVYGSFVKITKLN